MRVVLASKNPHKLVEISKITKKFGIELVLQSELGVDIDVEETGTTFEENSFLKAEAVMKATGLPALADDSGIAVDALTGEPGIYSARYGFDESHGSAGAGRRFRHCGGCTERRAGYLFCPLRLRRKLGRLGQNDAVAEKYRSRS